MIRNPIYGKIKLMFQTTNQKFIQISSLPASFLQSMSATQLKLGWIAFNKPRRCLRHGIPQAQLRSVAGPPQKKNIIYIYREIYRYIYIYTYIYDYMRLTSFNSPCACARARARAHIHVDANNNYMHQPCACM